MNFHRTERSSIMRSLLQDHGNWTKAINLEKSVKLALQNGHSAIAEMISTQNMGNDQKLLAYTLKKAAFLGDHQCIVSTLKHKAQILVTDTFLALALAASRNHTQIIETMLEAGVPVDYGADMVNLQSPLSRAIISGHDGAARFLLEKGANPNGQSGRYRNTPLYGASRCGNIAMVTTLLQAGAHVDAFSGARDGTALRGAAKEGKSEVVELLLKVGANVNTSNNGSSSTAFITWSCPKRTHSSCSLVD